MRAAEEAFAPPRAALDRAGVRFAIGGSWASTAFGEPRMTNDVDILAEFDAENRKYLRENAAKLEISELLEKLFSNLGQ